MSATQPGPCVEWTGSRNSKGYGVVMVAGRRMTAHRAAWLRSGRTANGLVIDHLCRNRLCVNLEHLEAVTNRENLLRGDTLPARELAKSICPQGHPLDGRKHDRRRANPIRYCTTCQREWDVARGRFRLDAAAGGEEG